MTKLIEVEYFYWREWNYNHKFVFIAFLGNSEVISLCSIFLIYGCIVFNFGCSIINSYCVFRGFGHAETGSGFGHAETGSGAKKRVVLRREISL